MSLLDPLLVAKLATMELRARSVVEGILAGRHRSLRQGHALEFAGHRAYTPSDEWRHIDWKVFARTDRWVVREQQDETNLRAVALLDTSRSMAFAGAGRLAKIRYASIVVAALSYLLIHRREFVGLGLFDASLRDFMPARGGAAHLAQLLQRLEELTCQGSTDFPASLQEAGQRLPRRSLVLIVSDFLFLPEKLFTAVRVLLARKHEVVALQVLDPEERDLPFRGDFNFQDLESGAVLRANADEIRHEYQRRMAGRLAQVARVFYSLGVDSQVFWTDQPFDASLSMFLSRRSRQR